MMSLKTYSAWTPANRVWDLGMPASSEVPLKHKGVEPLCKYMIPTIVNLTHCLTFLCRKSDYK